MQARLHTNPPNVSMLVQFSNILRLTTMNRLYLVVLCFLLSMFYNFVHT